jgi:hypothetical protein
MFRYVSLMPQFEECRKSHSSGMEDLDCFLTILSEKLSPKAAKVLSQAQKRHERYNSLLYHVLKVAVRSKRFNASLSSAAMEALIIKAIVAFELKSNKNNSDWTFRESGVTRLNDDFFLVQEYISSSQSKQFKQICDRWGDFVLTSQETEELKGVSDAERPVKKLEKVKPHFQPLWSFFVALCHALQEGENELNARDAFWLGLID